MDYRNVREAAETWGVSERLVQRLCAEGRIDGAHKFGKSWLIPRDAVKPEDIRKQWARQRLAGKRAAGATGAPSEAASSPTAAGSPAEAGDQAAARPDRPLHADVARRIAARRATSADAAAAAPDAAAVPDVLAQLMPLMNTPFQPGTCRQVIERFDDPDTRTVAQAEFCYFSGDAEQAARLAGQLLSHANLAVRLSACLIYAYANLPLGSINRARFALDELRSALATLPNAMSAQSQAAMAFTGYTSAVLLHLPLPEDAPPVNTLLPLLPPGLRAFALYVHAHQLYLKGEYARSLGVAEAALLLNSETYPIPQIYLRLVAVMDCMSLKRTDEARGHLLAAWDLARPDGLIEAFGEHHGLLGGMLESVIKSEWPQDFKRIIDITYRFSAGWRRVHNPATAETVADNLSTTEFAVSMLAARGWTNSEIGQHLDISANTVKSYLTSSFGKLGINKRQELGQFMLR